MRNSKYTPAVFWSVYLAAIVLAVLFLAKLANGQGQVTWEINDFSGGMNIGENWSQIQPNQGSWVKNVVIDDPVGTLQVRPGYTKVRDTLAAYTRTWSMHSHKLDNNKTYLLAVEERRDSGWASIFASSAAGRFTGGSATALAKAKWLYPTAGFWFTWNGLDYFFNGRNRPRVIDLVTDSLDTLDACTPMTPPAPGQLQADPLKRSGALNGWYQYAHVMQIPCSTQTGAAVPWAYRASVLSVPVEANNEVIRVSGYTKRINDSACTITGTDSVWVMTLRTRGNHSDYVLDSLFIIDSFKTRNDSIPKRVLIDTTSDASLTSGRFWGTIQTRSTSRWDEVVRDSHKRNKSYAPGSLTFLRSDTAFGTGYDTVNGSKCFTGGNGDWIGCLYTWTLRDRITGVESDTAPVLFVPYDHPNIDTTIKLGVPLPPSNRYERVIYKANAVWSWTVHHNPEPLAFSSPDLGWTSQIFYALDTMTNDTQSFFIDKVDPCSLEVYNEPYDRRVPLTNYAGAIVHENTLFAWDAEQVYFSVADTAAFPFFNSLEFDLGRGDPIVRLVSFDGFIAVYKKLSTWILYTRNGTVYDARKGNDGLGLVGPLAAASYGNTNFVVGQEGLYSEVTNPYRDHDLDRDYLDDQYPLFTHAETDLSKTVTVAFNDRVLISYPDEGKTRVYFLKSNAWGEWSFAFSAACVYDTGWGARTYPVLVFTKPENCKLFILDDTAQTDAGASFQGYWQKKYLGINDPNLKVISEARMYWDGGPADTFKVLMDVLDDRTLNYGTISFNRLNPRTFGREYFAAPNNLTGHYFWLRVWLPSYGPLIIRKIDLVAHGAGTD